MNPGRFYMPNIYMNQIPRESAILGGLAKGIRSFNWGKLLTGANKTLNVMNQTIPLIKQAKPMVNNVRSILKLAKVFNSEIADNKNNSINISKKTSTVDNKANYPTFFA